MKTICTLFFLCFITYLNSQIIVIDPGHGYKVDGTNPDGRSVIENTTSLDAGLKLQAIITSDCNGWTAYMTRFTANGWITLSQRSSMSNSWNADYYLSIHCNAGGGSGTETFWCNVSDASSTDDISFAQKIQSKMVQHGNWNSRRVVEDDSYIFHLAVLSGSNATGCLNEIGFVDSGDATKLTSNAWKDSFALAYKKAFELLEGNCTSTSIGTSDYCATAQQLLSNHVCVYSPGTLQGATTSISSKVSCDGFTGTAGLKDVFYYFNANATTHTIEVNPTGTTVDAVDALIGVYTGASCTSLNQIGCGGSTGSGGDTKYAYLSGLTVGQKYWIRLYDYGSVDPTDFNYQICLKSNVITTGLADELNAAEQLAVFPNPTNGIFSVELLNSSTDIFSYSVLNNLGQEIKLGDLNKNTKLVDITDQASGIYYLVIKTDKKSFIKKIIKE